jgi:mRNA-degrading endonuclease RelE of RelBE toxin-antitoxin system
MPTITKRAERDLEQLPPALRAKALAIIDRLDQEPALGKKLLGGLAGLRSVRLGRSHRIVYAVQPEVTIVTIGQRRDVYR